jgi:hypothetical protein
MLRKIILVLVVIILCTPLPRTIENTFFRVEFERPLNGGFVDPDRPIISLKNIFNGTFQSDFGNYFSYNMVGRLTMTRIYNQILYSFFNSLNSNANGSINFIGKDKYLFRFSYVKPYLDEPDDYKKNELFDKLILLAMLQKKVEEMGKLLVVIITPSKVSFYPEYLPNDLPRYASMKNTGEYSQNFYEYFVSQASEIGFRYFDFHDEFMELKNKGVDIFTKGGIHWTGLAVTFYFSELINAINENTEKKVGTIQTIKAEPVWGDAFTTDDDLEQILNRFPGYKSLQGKINKILPFYKHIFPMSQFYSYHMEVLSVPTDYQPSVFVCGGSFNWSWLHMLYGLDGWVTQGDKHIFSSADFSFYNSFVTKFPENTRISDVTDDFYSVLEKDIIIIEFNEQAMAPDASQFVFIKKLLDFIEKSMN